MAVFEQPPDLGNRFPRLRCTLAKIAIVRRVLSGLEAPVCFRWVSLILGRLAHTSTVGKSNLVVAIISYF
jgi:hypothetical protein